MRLFILLTLLVGSTLASLIADADSSTGLQNARHYLKNMRPPRVAEIGRPQGSAVRMPAALQKQQRPAIAEHTPGSFRLPLEIAPPRAPSRSRVAVQCMSSQGAWYHTDGKGYEQCMDTATSPASSTTPSHRSNGYSSQAMVIGF